MDLRTKETRDKYHSYRENLRSNSGCRFCEEYPLEEEGPFRHWKIIPNIFPYDLIAEKHDLLVPKRHFKNENEMTPEERNELFSIKTEMLPEFSDYHSIFENFSRARSMEHYHLHLLRYKPDLEE